MMCSRVSKLCRETMCRTSTWTAMRSSATAAMPSTAESPLDSGFVAGMNMPSSGVTLDNSNFFEQNPVELRPSEAARCPVIQPTFWVNDTPSLAPELYEIDCTGHDMAAGPKGCPEIKALIHEKFDKYGLVHLRNTGLKEMPYMSQWADVIFTSRYHYKGGANSRGPIEENVYDTGAPKEAHLHYHHEMAYLNTSVQQVAFCASAAVDDGTTRGAMFVADSMKATEEVLATPFGQKLKDLGICYVRCLTDKDAYKDKPKGWNGLDEVGVYNHWQRSFGTDDPAEVEKAAKEKGLQIDWGPNRYLRTKFYTDVYEYVPHLDKNTIYASVADDSIWHDTWPGVMELPSMESPSECTMHERPLKITFGDDSEFTREELQQFIQIYDNHGLPLNWKVGDVAIIDNWRWLHGRPEYHLKEGEERVLGVLLGPVFQRVGQHPDKW